MSIATNEAERRYPIEYSNFDCDVSKLSACRTAFSLGAEWQSQREPTEAEIEAAARRFYETTHEEEKRWYEMSEAYRNTYREWAESILTAARKAVTE